MKKIFVSLLIISGLFFANSCSNDFELITDWKDIPVVYGLISTADTAHYIRLERAFLDPKTSALELAQIPDSIYYADATVKLVNIEDNREYVFKKVDGNLEGYKRESGIFADTPNWLYKLKTNGIDTLSPATDYQLIINRGETSEPVTATAETLTDIEIRTPTIGTTIKFYSSPQPPAEPEPLDPSFRWIYDTDNTVLFNASLTFFYDETIDGVTEEKHFVWPLLTNFRSDGSTTSKRISMKTIEFYKTVAQNISENPAATRVARSVNVEVIGGGEAFRDYLDVNQANIGLTSSQVVPNFTNLSEGYGLFSSIFAISQDHFLDTKSRDSLRTGQYTRLLNFQ